MIDFYGEEIKDGFIRGIKTYMNTLASTVLKDAEEFIIDAISLKPGNKEFAIFFDPDDTIDPWRIMVGNTCKLGYLGENSGDIDVSGKTLFDAIKKING